MGGCPHIANEKRSVLGGTSKGELESLKHLLCTILPHAVSGGLKKDQFRIRKAGKKQVFLCKLDTTSESKSHIIPTAYCIEPMVGQCRSSLLGSPWEFSFFSPALMALLFHTCSSSVAFLIPHKKVSHQACNVIPLTALIPTETER